MDRHDQRIILPGASDLQDCRACTKKITIFIRHCHKIWESSSLNELFLDITTHIYGLRLVGQAGMSYVSKPQLCKLASPWASHVRDSMGECTSDGKSNMGAGEPISYSSVVQQAHNKNSQVQQSFWNWMHTRKADGLKENSVPYSIHLKLRIFMTSKAAAVLWAENPSRISFIVAEHNLSHSDPADGRHSKLDPLQIQTYIW